ncbi:hypothetical protein AB0F34_19010, partial [Streptomyces fradiae]
ALAVRDLTVGGLDVQLRLVGATRHGCAGPERENLARQPGARGRPAPAPPRTAAPGGPVRDRARGPVR